MDANLNTSQNSGEHPQLDAASAADITSARKLPPHFSQFEVSRLENGAAFVYVPLEHSVGFTIIVGFPIGSRYEQVGEEGASHFLEHMLTQGSARFPTSTARDEFIDGLGGYSNAFTGNGYTAYFVVVPGESAREAVTILSDQVLASRFAPEEVENQRGRITNEIHQRALNPTDHAMERLQTLMYQGSRLAHPVIGSPESVLGLTPQHLLDYRDRMYRSGSMVIVCAGPKDSEIEDLVRASFSSNVYKSGTNPEFERAQFGSSRSTGEFRDGPMVSIAVGFPGMSISHQDRFALLVMHSILGGGSSSRLHSTISEREGLTYGIESGPTMFEDTGHQLIVTSTERRNLDLMLHRIREEVERLPDSVTLEEVERAKRSIRGKFLLGFQNSDKIARSFCIDALLRSPETIVSPVEHLSKIEAVTFDDVRRVARQWLIPAEARISLVGNFSKEPNSL